jgi:hypothetical protein
MDWDKFNYSTIGDNILDRFFNEGHGIKTVGDINDFLKLPKVFNDENELKKFGVEETKNEEELKPKLNEQKKEE